MQSETCSSTKQDLGGFQSNFVVIYAEQLTSSVAGYLRDKR